MSKAMASVEECIMKMQKVGYLKRDSSLDLSPVVALLNSHLADFEVGDPLKRLLEPKVDFVQDSFVFLRIVLTTPDATDQNKYLKMTFKTPVPRTLSYVTSKPQVLAHIKRYLMDILDHEVDESLHCDGLHVLDPHLEEHHAVKRQQMLERQREDDRKRPRIVKSIAIVPMTARGT